MCVLIDLFMSLGCEGAAIDQCLSSFSEKQERKDISRNLVAIKAQSVQLSHHALSECAARAVLDTKGPLDIYMKRGCLDPLKS